VERRHLSDIVWRALLSFMAMNGASIKMLACVVVGIALFAVADEMQQTQAREFDPAVDVAACYAPAEDASSLLQTRGRIAHAPVATLASPPDAALEDASNRSWARRLARHQRSNSEANAALAASSSRSGTFPPACGVGAPDCSIDADLAGVGCSLSACCAGICAVDPFCCNVGWDEVCRNRAMVECAPEPLRDSACGPTVAQNGCASPSSSPGCSDTVCCSIICTQLRSSCCSSSWSPDCVSDAAFFCVELS